MREKRQIFRTSVPPSLFAVIVQPGIRAKSRYTYASAVPALRTPDRTGASLCSALSSPTERPSSPESTHLVHTAPDRWSDTGPPQMRREAHATCEWSDERQRTTPCAGDTSQDGTVTTRRFTSSRQSSPAATREAATPSGQGPQNLRWGHSPLPRPSQLQALS